jgi:putative ABC transport system permease protein
VPTQPPYFPPRWADRFLAWYCRPDLLEEIQGDTHELYYRTAKDNRQKANIQFAWNVLRFFRWKNVKRRKTNFHSSNSSAMLKSYLLTGIRNMSRNLTPSLINITGLSVALGCAVMIFILENSYYDLDSMHQNRHRIYEVVSRVKDGDQTPQWASSPQPLSSLLADNSAVESVMRARRFSGSVRVGEKVFRERLLVADPEFMNAFSFKLLAGNRNALTDKNQVMISEPAAIKYFGTANPVGQSLSIKFNEDIKREFTVGAIMEDTPANSSMYFDYLLPMSVWEDLNPDRVNDWSKASSVTFVLLKEGATPNQLVPTLENFKKIQNASSSQWPVVSTELVQLPEVAHRSYDITDALSWSNHPAAMVAFAVIAVFLILLACFNYMNVAVASVSTRLKEIGIRKVVGSGKKEIIQQFLVENVLMVSLALIAGTAFAYFFLLPGFNSLYEVKIAFEFSSWQAIVLFFGGILLVVALISGAYPALYVASFNAVKILKGKEKFGNKSLFSRVLLGLQFTLSFTAVVACQVFIWSSYYFESRDWGYNQQQSVVVPITSFAQYNELKDFASSHRGVVSHAGANQHIGKTSKSSVIMLGAEKFTVEQFPVGPGYLEAMNVRMKEGRSFDETIEADHRESVIVNESFVKRMGWQQPLHQTFQLDSVSHYVIGVVSDFRYDDFFTAIGPCVMTLTPKENFSYFVARAEAGHVNEVADFFEEKWRKIAPEDPYNGFLQSEVFDSFLRGNRSNNKVLYFISGVAVLLVAMGLYGLVSYNLTRRMKEFSVRKIFGASQLTLFRLMNRDYVWIVAIAFFAGAPAGAYLMDLMIKSVYPDQIPPTFWPYVISIGTMALIVLATIGGQLRRVITDNPNETLRTE